MRVCVCVCVCGGGGVRVCVCACNYKNIIYILVKNIIKKTNSRKTRYDLRTGLRIDR